MEAFSSRDALDDKTCGGTRALPFDSGPAADDHNAGQTNSTDKGKGNGMAQRYKLSSETVPWHGPGDRVTMVTQQRQPTAAAPAPVPGPTQLWYVINTLYLYHHFYMFVCLCSPIPWKTCSLRLYLLIEVL